MKGSQRSRRLCKDLKQVKELDISGRATEEDGGGSVMAGGRSLPIVLREQKGGQCIWVGVNEEAQ